ncbi:DUF4855 domain-containing protein, partial [Eubacteriales bacterium OttesenSCG-928-G02]|nr:DUF4855 domain-containing protein [Eubacteriales bacterium OttesenSCG-928-G02]
VYIFANNEYNLVGYINAPIIGTYVENNIYNLELRLPKSVKASKIKFVLEEFEKEMVLISEAYAYKYEGTKADPSDLNAENYYADVNLDISSPEELWCECEEDYNETKNLVLNSEYFIRSHSVITDNVRCDEKNTKDSAGLLTDGIYAEEAHMNDMRWHKFTGGSKRTVYFDLKKTSAVSGYKISILKEIKTGINYPNVIKVGASIDGINWQIVHMSTGIYATEDSEIKVIDEAFEKVYKARFMSVEFAVAPHAYISEIEIIGCKNIKNAVELVPDRVYDQKEANVVNEYATPEKFGFRDMLLGYIRGRKGAPSITKEEFLHHMAYVPGDKIEDILFDSVLFLPVVAFLYEGYKKRPLKKADWLEYIETHYEEGKNLVALEELIGEIKQELNIPDYKVKIHLSLFYPVISVTDFGEVNGKNLDFSNTKDRVEAVLWMVDHQLKLFKEHNFKHIELDGFYWFTEEIDLSDRGIVEILKSTTDHVRELGYINSWIPYYQAANYDNWKELGFDLACYQPNYAFNYEIPESRLYEAAVRAKELGMCIEVEVNGNNNRTDVDRLKSYMYVGALTGYMNDAVHMYYQGTVPGSVSSYRFSKDPYINSMYDDLYKFMKGTFETEVSAPENDKIICEKGAFVKANVKGTPSKTIKAVEVNISPAYGELTFNPDGSYEYKPYSEFDGEDSFEVVYNYGYIKSKPAVINIIVK